MPGAIAQFICGCEQVTWVYRANGDLERLDAPTRSVALILVTDGPRAYWWPQALCPDRARTTAVGASRPIRRKIEIVVVRHGPSCHL